MNRASAASRKRSSLSCVLAFQLPLTKKAAYLAACPLRAKKGRNNLLAMASNLKENTERKETLRMFVHTFGYPTCPASSPKARNASKLCCVKMQSSYGANTAVLPRTAQRMPCLKRTSNRHKKLPSDRCIATSSQKLPVTRASLLVTRRYRRVDHH